MLLKENSPQPVLNVDTQALKNDVLALGYLTLPCYLRSLGGIQNADFPRIGHLQATPFLSQCPAIKGLLSQLTQPLGRIWLAKTTENSLPKCHYQRWAYQQLAITVDVGIYLVIEYQINHGYQQIKDDGLAVISDTAFNDFIQTITQGFADSEITPHLLKKLQTGLEKINQNWQHTYQQWATHPAGELRYRRLLRELQQLLRLHRHFIKATEADCCLHILLSSLDLQQTPARRMSRRLLSNQANKRQQVADDFQPPNFIRPTFIVSPPRAGSTLLFNNLSKSAQLWTTGDENHRGLEKIAGLHPKAHGFASNRLDVSDATDNVRDALLRLFGQRLAQPEQTYLQLPVEQRPDNIYFLEKTPKNALRILFLKKLFPDARFIYLYREPFGNISSLMEGWQSGRFTSYQNLPDWFAGDWSFLLIPDWQQLNNKSLVEIASAQWQAVNQTIVQDLQQINRHDWHFVTYDALIQQPAETLKSLVNFMGLDWDANLEATCKKGLALTSVTLSAPQADKWKKHAIELNKVAIEVNAMEKHVFNFIAK